MRGRSFRAALARSIAIKPEVILYDEPTTGLDPANIQRIGAMIQKLQKELGVTSIVVTHDLATAFKVADRIVMIHQGKIIFDGSEEQIKASDNPNVQRFVRGEADEAELAGLL